MMRTSLLVALSLSLLALDPPAADGGKSYSSGRTSTGSRGPSGVPRAPSGGGYGSRPPSVIRPSIKPPTPLPSGGKSYTQPRDPLPKGGKTYSERPFDEGYDIDAGAAKRREESRWAYTKGQQPRDTYTDSTGKTQPLDPRDKRVEDLRGKLDEDKWITRQERQEKQYRDVRPPSGPPVIYRDPYHNLFWWWLLAQSLDTQARWAYHHRDAMAKERYDRLEKNAEVKKRIEEMEREGKPRDPTYTPENLPPDLMYDDEYVEAAYNPQNSAIDRAARIFLAILLGGALLAFLIWIVFIKRWGGREERGEREDSGANPDFRSRRV